MPGATGVRHAVQLSCAISVVLHSAYGSGKCDGAPLHFGGGLHEESLYLSGDAELVVDKSSGVGWSTSAAQGLCSLHERRLALRARLARGGLGEAMGGPSAIGATNGSALLHAVMYTESMTVRE